MEVTLNIPDAIVLQLTRGGDLSRIALESIALEALRAGRITEVQLCEMLGLDRIEADGFLKTHGIFYEMTLDDVEQDITDLKACLGT